MNLLIKNVQLYSPQFLGKKDVLTINDKIVAVEDAIASSSLPFDVDVVDATGRYLIPGLIDQHVHVIGGGGEGGFHTRTPEAGLSKITSAGITTVVGLLGTDGTARNLEALYAKTTALNNEGITAYMLTGSYEYPSVTICGSVRKDMILIDRVIGVKVAHSDHRSSNLSRGEMARLAQDVRVGGMIGGKAGIVTMHMGDGKDNLQTIFDIVENLDTPIKHFRPTHLTRNRTLLEDAKRFALMGGYIDFSSGIRATPDNGRVKVSRAIRECLEIEGFDATRITVSSDGQGSAPVYDEHGNVTGVGIGELKCNHSELVDLVKEEGFDLADAVPFFSSNVAKALDLNTKGAVAVGNDADFLILDKDLEIETVVARGRVAVREKEVVLRGFFEQ
jgi:beta-aspartyl-dipeptidase (metallo-type)